MGSVQHDPETTEPFPDILGKGPWLVLGKDMPHFDIYYCVTFRTMNTDAISV